MLLCYFQIILFFISIYNYKQSGFILYYSNTQVMSIIEYFILIVLNLLFLHDVVFTKFFLWYITFDSSGLSQTANMYFIRSYSSCIQYLITILSSSSLCFTNLYIIFIIISLNNLSYNSPPYLKYLYISSYHYVDLIYSRLVKHISFCLYWHITGNILSFRFSFFSLLWGVFRTILIKTSIKTAFTLGS